MVRTCERRIGRVPTLSGPFLQLLVEQYEEHVVGIDVHHLEDPAVGLQVLHDLHRLQPDQARNLGQLLIEAADIAQGQATR
jgi:hypothetical protein